MTNEVLTSEALPAGAARGRVLLVDDEPVLRAMASSMLTLCGWDVMTAASAEEALQLLKYCRSRGSRMDAVIMDLVMPGGMSGVEAVEALRALQPDVRIIACSGFLLGEGSHEACTSVGFNDVLPKPYSMEQISEALDRCLHRAETVPA